MTLHLAQQQFLTALRDSITSEEPLRDRFEKLYSQTVEKMAADPCITADTWQRITKLRHARPVLSNMAEADVKELLAEIVTIFDALEGDYYGPCFDKIARTGG